MVNLWGLFVDVVHRVFSSLNFCSGFGVHGVFSTSFWLWWSLMSSLVEWSRFCLPRGVC